MLLLLFFCLDAWQGEEVVGFGGFDPFHVAKIFENNAVAVAGVVQDVAGFVHFLFGFFQQTFEFVVLRFYGTQHFPHLGGALIQCYRAETDAPEIPDIPANAKIENADLPELRLEIPDFDLPELEIPKIEIPALEFEIPEIEPPTVRFELPELPDLPVRMPKPDEPAVDSRAVQMLQSPVQDLPYIQPSATSTVVNNSYTYNSSTAAPDESPRPVYNISAKFEIDGERFAEYTAERVDALQGEAVTLTERGTAH